MPTQVTSYKCPACTGPLHFAGASGKLECEYCGNTYEIKEIEALYADKEADAAKGGSAGADDAKGGSAGADAEEAASKGEEWGEDAEKMRSYNCPSCGAQLFCDENTAVTSCPYCGNPTIVEERFEGILRPNCVLPFKLTKEDAKAALRSHYKNKFFLPKTFKTENHIEEIKGVYVPFWLFDGEAKVSMDFNATKSNSHREGDYKITKTSYYDVRRTGAIAFERVPVDGSKKMPDDLMDSIEPYDYSELKDFSMAYLPGYLADKYDVSAETAFERANERCINTAVSATENTVVGYNTVETKSQQAEMHKKTVRYALLPVWLLSTKWKDSDYLFAMNAQTGKLVGDLPIDKNKARALFFGMAAVFSTVFSLLFSLPLGRFIAELVERLIGNL